MDVFALVAKISFVLKMVVTKKRGFIILLIKAVLIVLAQLNLYYIEWLRTFYMNQNVCACL